MRSRLVAYSFALILVGVVFAPMASAASNDNVATQLQVDLQPGASNSNSTVVDAMNESSIPLESDIIFSDLTGVQGRYSGPYMQSSLFQFSQVGGYFQFATNFTIGSETIMNGATTFWVRVPIMPDQYEWWHLWCGWGYFRTIEGIETSADYTFGTLLPYKDPALFYLGDAWNWGSGNVWSTSSGSTYQIVNTQHGLYVEYKGVFKPDQQFTMAFAGVLKNGERPEVFLTQELPALNSTQLFRFYEPYEVRDPVTHTLNDFGYKYQHNETLGVAPAWAFVFVNGMGQDGMSSYKLYFGNNVTDYIEWGNLRQGGITYEYPVDDYQNNSFFSFYMPFSATVFNAAKPGLNPNSIDWQVDLHCEAGMNTPFGAGGRHMGFNHSGFPYLHDIRFWVNNTQNYLLFSSPYWIGVIPQMGIYDPPPRYVSIFIRLTPMQKASITLLSSDINAPDSIAPMLQTGYWGHYHHEDERAAWDGVTPVNAHALPLYNSMSFTEGRWAQLNETKLYWVYNFGWGIGYSFPGETSIKMFIDNGGQYFYNGSYKDFPQSLNQSFWDKIIAAIVGPIIQIIGYVWDGLQYIWDVLVNLGTWIYNTVSAIINWIVSIVKDIAGKVSHIVEAMIYGVPILMILFAVTYSGQYLYTGKMPKFSKERRLLRKMRPGAINRKRLRLQKKLKYPVAIKAQMRHQANRVQYRIKNRYEVRTQKANLRTQREGQKQLAIRERMDARARRERGQR